MEVLKRKRWRILFTKCKESAYFTKKLHLCYPLPPPSWERKLNPFKILFENELASVNRWVWIAELEPWDDRLQVLRDKDMIDYI